MTEVLPSSSPSHLPSSSPISPLSLASNDGDAHQTLALISSDGDEDDAPSVGEHQQHEGGDGALVSGRKGGHPQEHHHHHHHHSQQQLSLLALVVTIFRKSWVGCNSAERCGEEDLRVMEIGWPTNVRHVAHVTFDRFHGFLGLPVEFEPDVPRRAPSASASVFGVSAESMQCSFDSRGNSVPTILLQMQRRLYLQGGLQAEGMFRINAENSQEEYVRDQLNSGIVPDGIDVHCLAGLIKAWFRELPTGVLDPLMPEQVMQCHTEEECALLVKLLPPMEAALLDWAVNLMADVVQEEHHNKMNAHNIAMVFAPNMTQMVDPLTALMYAVQVMNFLKTLIERALKYRQNSVIPADSSLQLDPSNENGCQSPLQLLRSNKLEENEKDFTDLEPCHLPIHGSVDGSTSSSSAPETLVSYGTGVLIGDQPCEVPIQMNLDPVDSDANSYQPRAANYGSSCRIRTGQSSTVRKWPKRVSSLPAPQVSEPAVKSKGISIVSRINSRVERVEAWR